YASLHSLPTRRSSDLVVWIERSKTVRQALALSLRTGFSRIPVIGESVDEIVGVINLKERARAYVESAAAHQAVAEWMGESDFVRSEEDTSALQSRFDL